MREIDMHIGFATIIASTFALCILLSKIEKVLTANRYISAGVLSFMHFTINENQLNRTIGPILSSKDLGTSFQFPHTYICIHSTNQQQSIIFSYRAPLWSLLILQLPTIIAIANASHEEITKVIIGTPVYTVISFAIWIFGTPKPDAIQSLLIATGFINLDNKNPPVEQF